MKTLLNKDEIINILEELNNIYTDAELSEILWVSRSLLTNIRNWKLQVSRTIIMSLSLFMLGRSLSDIGREKKYNDIISLCKEYIKYEWWLDDLLYDLPIKVKFL